MIGADPKSVAWSSRINEICGGGGDEHEEHDELDTKIEGKTHTQDTHRLSLFARFTILIESQGRDSKSKIPWKRLTCKG
jgi:hypothetical protein